MRNQLEKLCLNFALIVGIGRKIVSLRIPYLQKSSLIDRNTKTISPVHFHVLDWVFMHIESLNYLIVR